MPMTAKDREKLRKVNVANANTSLGNEDPKRKETKRKQDLDMGTDPKTGKMANMKKSDYKKGGKVKTKKYMAGGMAMPGAGAAPMGGGAPAMPMTEEQKKKKMMEEMMKKKALAGGSGAPMGGAPAPAGTTMTAKAGGKVPKAKKKKMMGGGMANKAYKSGGKVRGAGVAKQGVRKCKMR
jgi:hypothetical protein